MEIRTYNKGDVIFRQGEAAESMFDIRWGKVGIYIDYGMPQQKQLVTLENEGFFGEMGMIDHAPRSATAVVLENGTRLSEITEVRFGELFREKPAKVLVIMQNLSNRLRKLTRNYMEACETAAGIVQLEEAPASLGKGAEEEIKARAEHFAKVAREGFYSAT